MMTSIRKTFDIIRPKPRRVAGNAGQDIQEKVELQFESEKSCANVDSNAEYLAPGLNAGRPNAAQKPLKRDIAGSAPMLSHPKSCSKELLTSNKKCCGNSPPKRPSSPERAEHLQLRFHAGDGAPFSPLSDDFSVAGNSAIHSQQRMFFPALNGVPAALRTSPVVPQSAKSTPVVHQSCRATPLRRGARSTPLGHCSARSTPVVHQSARSTPIHRPSHTYDHIASPTSFLNHRSKAISSPVHNSSPVLKCPMSPTGFISPTPAVKTECEATIKETPECSSLSKSSSDDYDNLINRKKVLPKWKVRRRGQTPVQFINGHSPDHQFHQIPEHPELEKPKKAQETSVGNKKQGFYGGSLSDENRYSGHATTSDARSSYISSSPTDEDNLRALLEHEHKQHINQQHNQSQSQRKISEIAPSNTKVNAKRSAHSRRKVGDHHLRRVNANDNLLAAVIAEDIYAIHKAYIKETLSHVQQIMHAMEQLKMRVSSVSNGYSTSTSAYSSVSGNSLESEPDFRRLTKHSSLETIATNVTTADEFVWLDSHSCLVELQHLPWSNKEVLKVLQQGRLENFVDRISMEAVLRLSYLLQRPLVLIAREAQRFSRVYGLCSKNEIISSIKVILVTNLADTCIKAGHRAAAIYAVSGESLTQSETYQAGLQLSVAKFHRWMSDVNIGTFVHDFAAIYLTAAIENLLEEIVLLCLANTETIVSDQVLNNCIENSPDLWGIFQPNTQLISGHLFS